MDWLKEEIEALERQWDEDRISSAEYYKQMSALQRDARQQRDHEDIIAAGRGHLLR